MIDIITPWLGHPELIPGYEHAVRGARVIIIGQGNPPDVTAALQEMVFRLGNDSVLVPLPENVYFAAANNLGLERVRGEVACFLNNDVVAPSPAWLDAVARDVQPDGLYSPAVLAFDVDGEPHPYAEGWCLAARTETIRRIGGWNETDFPRAYAEDVELSWRARRMGCSLYQTRWKVQHIGNVTNRATPDGYAFAEAQRERFREMVRAGRKAAKAAAGGK